MTTRRRLYKLMLVLGSVAITLIAAELLLRAAYLVQHAIKPPHSQFDGDWGWKTTSSVELSYERPGYGPVEYSTNERGFRVFGDVDTPKTKVFVVGDSSTQAIQISDGQGYYNYLADNDDGLEVFVYGVGGYGTLQQALALERYMQKIDPDIVLWQFNDNDLINSDVRLEAASNENNNHMLRPYLEGGRIVLRHPDGLPGRLSIHSYVMRKLVVLRSSIAMRVSGTIEPELVPGNPDLERGLQTMRGIVAESSRPSRTERSWPSACPTPVSATASTCSRRSARLPACTACLTCFQL